MRTSRANASSAHTRANHPSPYRVRHQPGTRGAHRVCVLHAHPHSYHENTPHPGDQTLTSHSQTACELHIKHCVIYAEHKSLYQTPCLCVFVCVCYRASKVTIHLGRLIAPQSTARATRAINLQRRVAESPGRQRRH